MMRWRRLIALVLILSLGLQIAGQSFAGASATSLSNYYSNHVSPRTNYNVDQVGPYNAFFANRQETIHPGTGNLTVSETDLVLPGRNGLDLSLSRIYQNQQASVYRMMTRVESYTDSYFVYDPVFDCVQEVDVPGHSVTLYRDVWVAGYWETVYEDRYQEGYYSTQCEWKWQEGRWRWGRYYDPETGLLTPYEYWEPGYWYQVCTQVWNPGYWYQVPVDVYRPGHWATESYEEWVETTYKTVCTLVSLGYWVYYDEYYVVTDRSTDTFLDKRNALGLGWQWDFPSLEIRGSDITLHSGGQSLMVDWNSSSRFKDYLLLDMRFDNDSNSFTNGQMSSRYKVTNKDGRITYFGNDGRLLGIVDRYGNKLTFQYTTWNGSPVFSKIIDTIGREVTFTYSSSQVTVTSPDSQSPGFKVWTYNLSSTQAGKYLLSSAVDPLGRETSYSYNLQTANFNFQSKTYLNVTNVYANLSCVNYPTGASSNYTYLKTTDNLGSDGAREVYKISSRQDNIGSLVGNRVTYSYSGEPGGYPTYYNPQNLPSSYTYSGTMTKADGTTVKTIYSNKHLNIRTETIGPWVKQISETTYDVKKTPTQVVTTTYSPDGTNSTSTTYTSFDNYNNLISSTDAIGTITTYTYETTYHQPTSIQADRGDGVVVRTEYGVNANNGNREWERKVNVENGVDKSITTYYTYDTYGNMLSSRLVMEDGSERQSLYEYSLHAYLTKVTIPYIDAQGVSRSEVTHYTYDPNTGLQLSVIDPLGACTSYEYDTLGRLKKQINPDSSEKTYNYDDQNLIVTIALENGSSGRSVYDPLARLTEQQVKQGGSWHTVVTLSYDNMSRKQSETDALGNTTVYQYDGAGRVTNIVYSDQVEESIVYDDAARSVTVIDGNGNSTKQIYDAQGRLVGVRQKPDAGGSTEYITSYTYDGLGNIISVADAKGNTTTRQYDALNRLRTLTYPSVSRNAVHYTYNNAGQQLTENNGSVTSYTYDARGLLTKVTYEDSTYNAFSYDLGRRLTNDLASASGVSSAYTYDNRGRLTELSRTIDSNAYALGLGYDSAGNVTSITYPGNETVTQVYGELNRLMAINGYANLYYDAAGNLSQMQYSNGINTNYTYNSRGLLSSIHSPVLGLTYTYDNVGNITSINNETYTYDGLNRLLTANKPGHNYQASYQYDPVGNRMSQIEDGMLTAYTYNAVNELSQAVLGRRLGDINGDGAIDALDRTLLNNHSLGVALITDPISLLAADCNQDGYVNSADYVPLNRHVIGIQLLPNITVGPAAPIGAATQTTYTWDARGNLTGKAAYVDETTTHTWVYTYDLANRLIEVKKNDVTIGTYAYDANGIRAKKVENGATTVYLALGHQVMYEETEGVPTKHIYGGGQRIAEVKDSVISFFHNDHLGSARAVTDAAGTLVAVMVTKPFGEPHTSDAPTDYLFTGKELDDTNLYYFAARYYDPSVGRFISQDTHWNHYNMIYGDDKDNKFPLISAITQSTNLYVYCANNPLMYVDPDGEIAYPGQIHNLVVNHIAAKHGFYKEQTINYKVGRGRADLISSSGQVWDVKPDKPVT